MTGQIYFLRRECGSYRHEWQHKTLLARRLLCVILLNNKGFYGMNQCSHIGYIQSFVSILKDNAIV
uniref:hypothetical protein n=1 Tax=Enterobacter asburiae TaxID=61645 RepID=UPI003D36BA25